MLTPPPLTRGKEVFLLSRAGVLATRAHTSSFCRSGATYPQEWQPGQA